MNSEEKIAELKMERWKTKPKEKRLYTTTEIITMINEWKQSSQTAYNVELIDDFVRFLEVNND